MHRSILLLAVLATACAKQPMSTESTTAAQKAAMAAGAEDVPQAKLALQLSKENVERAEALYKDGDKEEAASMMTRAEADAELAAALAKADDEKTQANEAMERIRKVQSAN